ncbi:MAG TPA: ATP-grasp domain-containing protein [Rudaea sp.]|jgi:predicted ATP-grasp superfamily ATP-dependent carboligase|nr:ATP-grasp domain-containing protein [Rudaea sp.]
MRILIVSLSPQWKEPPRLARALAEQGAAVTALAVAGSLLDRSRFVERRHRLDDEPPAQVDGLVTAIADFAPDRLVPGDERSVRWLHDVYREPGVAASVKTLIAASLGDPQCYGRTTDKLAMSQLARELGIAQLETAALARAEDAYAFVQRHGWPVVVKACRGYAGIDVHPCANLRELRRTLREFREPTPHLIQRFAPGVTWMTAFVAHRGEVLGALVAEKQRQHPALIGPSTIVRFAYDAAMHESARALVRRLGYSGFGSVDFLRTQGRDPLFIEFNPRATPICHLGGRLGVDLACAFVHGRACDSAGVRNERVALFPQELQRDRSGAGLVGCWHDIPEDEPELIAAMLPA